MATQYVDLDFPFRGLTQGASDEAVPAGFTVGSFRNMRPRDWKAGGQRRGSTRPGCRKLLDDPVSGDERVQAVATVRTVENTGASSLGALVFDDDFDRSDTSEGVLGDFDGGGDDWFIYMGRLLASNAGGSLSLNTHYLAAFDAGTDTNGAQVVGNVVVDGRNDDTTSGTGRMSYCYCAPTATTEPTDNYALKLEFTTQASLANTEFHVGFVCFGKKSIVAGGAIDNAFIIGVRGYTGVSSNFTGRMVPIYGFNSTTSDYNDLKNMDPGATAGGAAWPTYAAGPWYPATTGGAAVIYPAIQPGTTYTLELRVNGVRVELLMDGIRIAVIQDVTQKSDGSGATVAATSQTEFGFFINNVGAGSRAGLLSVDNFECYRANVNPPETMVRIVAIAGGDVAVGTESGGLTNGTDATDAYAGDSEITLIIGPGPGADSSAGIQYAYMLDGQSYKKVDVASGLVTSWTATAGTLPASGTVASQKARYGLSWDGSFVWYGILSAPDVFGATRSLDWGDFNETPAVALRDGSEAFISGISEPISCIFPLGERRLGIASQNALYLLSDRVPLGGSIVSLTDRTGVVGPFAYAIDQFGNVHIVHTSGHWIVPRGGGTPTLVSRGRLDEFFRSIDSNASVVQCQWSNRQDGLHIFITDRETPTAATTHLFWDRQEDAYCPDTMPGKMNPTATAIYTDTLGRERVVFGSNDGYLRVIDSQYTNDDGTDIDGIVPYPPLTRGGLDRVVLRGLEIRLGSADDAATVDLSKSSTVPGLVTASPAGSIDIPAGLMVKRAYTAVGGSAVGITLSGTRFSIEKMRAMVESGGPVYGQS